MKKISVAGVAMTALMAIAACSPTQQGAAIGAGTGAVIGGVTTNSVAGAAVGAAVGGVAGALVGQVAGQPDRCYYRDSSGQLFIDDCPAG
nr:YMGG-like glycine zipper-containing protein [Pelagibacterium montanilacus]